jgi:putative ABC transport system permease protein
VSMLQRKLRRDLLAMKGQVLTIALVVAVATGGFMGSLGTYHALGRARDTFYTTARFGDAFIDVKRAPQSLLQEILRVPDVVDAEANVQAATQLSVSGVPEPLIARLVGIPPSTGPRLNQLHVRRGRMIERASVAEALVDEGFAAARHLAPGDRVTVLMNGKREVLHIVGIGLSPEFINPSQGGVFPDPKGLGVFWIDEERLAGAFDLKDAFNHVSVTLSKSASAPRVLADLDELLSPYGGRGAYLRAEQMSHKIVTQEMDQQRVLGTVMPTLFIWVAAFLLNVVLGRQISTQREQIAALKALGYANSAIVLHYLQSVLVFVMLGLLLGVGIGNWFGRYMTGMYSDFFHFPAIPFSLEPTLLLIAGGVSAAAAFSGALLAIRNVVRLSPAQAMRPPAPPRYRQLLLERLGAAGWMPMSLRMILRNMERRPLRSLLSAAGVAASVALIVSGTFWWDAINYMVDIQFNSVERSDAVIALVNPRATAARFDASRLPGVLEATPYRAVAVQLRAAQRGYRTAILGLEPGANLRRTLDESRQPVALPPSGLLLSSRLAERLQVGAGDLITVEVLEGQRVHRLVRVEGLVTDMFALMAYMDLRALNGLLDEADAFSALDVKLDTHARAALFARIRTAPAIATVALKSNSLQSFREISARNVLVFTSVFTVFAAIIAVGVVYNSARIALAERAWELASLRVLGFTRTEVSTFLLGELALEVAAGIPLGLWMGRYLAEFLTLQMQSETFVIPVIIAPKTYVLAVFTVVVAALGSALVVRRKIDGLDLVSVLKTRE